MKYLKLTSCIYLKFNEYECDSLNGYTKNRVYKTLGNYHIYCNKEDRDKSILKLKKEITKDFNERINKIL